MIGSSWLYLLLILDIHKLVTFTTQFKVDNTTFSWYSNQLNGTLVDMDSRPTKMDTAIRIYRPQNCKALRSSFIRAFNNSDGNLATQRQKQNSSRSLYITNTLPAVEQKFLCLEIRAANRHWKTKECTEDVLQQHSEFKRQLRNNSSANHEYMSSALQDKKARKRRKCSRHP